ncbi:MAG: aldehyde ferredoxin oxidoreductase, partial [Deltaproteobacteria bacterium]
GYECRGLNGQALQFAINNRGGDHHGYGLPARIEGYDGTGPDVAGKGELVKRATIARAICDSVAVCTFARAIYDNPTLVETLSCLSGEVWSVQDIEEVGLRVMAQERLFNMREGISRSDDTLPDRLLKEPKPDGPAKGNVVPLEELKDQYYEALGWDAETGNPGDNVLKALGIEK